VITLDLLGGSSISRNIATNAAHQGHSLSHDTAYWGSAESRGPDRSSGAEQGPIKEPTAMTPNCLFGAKHAALSVSTHAPGTRRRNSPQAGTPIRSDNAGLQRARAKHD